MIILTLQGKKTLKFRVLKQLAPRQRASKWLSWSSNLGSLTLYPESSIHQTHSSFRNKLRCLLLQELFPEKGTNTSLSASYFTASIKCNVFVYTFSLVLGSPLETETTSYSSLCIIRTYLAHGAPGWLSWLSV